MTTTTKAVTTVTKKTTITKVCVCFCELLLEPFCGLHSTSRPAHDLQLGKGKIQS